MKLAFPHRLVSVTMFMSRKIVGSRSSVVEIIAVGVNETISDGIGDPSGEREFFYDVERITEELHEDVEHGISEEVEGQFPCPRRDLVGL